MSSAAPEYRSEFKDAYTFAEVQQITLDATQNLKTHLTKTLLFLKLAPANKD
jgi:hypothetical protein